MNMFLRSRPVSGCFHDKTFAVDYNKDDICRYCGINTKESCRKAHEELLECEHPKMRKPE